MNEKLTKDEVMEIFGKQIERYRGLAASVRLGDAKIDPLVESEIMYDLLAAMAWQHLELVEQIK